MSIETGEAVQERASAGDAEALHQLLDQYGPRVRSELRVARRWQSAVDVDDVMQVTYLEAFLAIRLFQPAGPDSFLKWLRRMAENNLRDAVRELERDKRPPRERQVTLPAGEDSYVALLELCGAATTTPSREAARHEARDLLEAALRRLPPDYEQVIRLYSLEGRPASDVASAMNRSVGAIHLLRLRAFERLRSVLGSGSVFQLGA